MKRKQLRFGGGFKVVLGNRRSQAAKMVMSAGDGEGDPGNRHRSADQWLYVVEGTGRATVNGKAYGLKTGTLLLIASHTSPVRVAGPCKRLCRSDG